MKPKLRFDILARDNFTCQYCGAQAPQARLQIDHIEPVSKGGSDAKTNLVTACRRCNIGKFSDSARPPKALIGPLRLTREQWIMLDRLEGAHWVAFHDWVERLEDDEAIVQAVETEWAAKEWWAAIDETPTAADNYGEAPQ